MLLAAGRGERMRPLTDTVPKPLLPVAGKPLLVWHLERLAAIGVEDVVVNLSHLGEAIRDRLGDGAAWGLRIHYSDEGAQPLETGGGLLHALPLLGDAPFLLVNGDVWSDLDFGALPPQPQGLAHLVLVANPAHHPDGDFWLAADEGLVHDGVTLAAAGALRLTYAGIGVFRGEILREWRSVVGHAPGARAAPPRFPLAPLLRAAMRTGQVTGQRHPGAWSDVGTPERLAQLDARLSSRD